MSQTLSQESAQQMLATMQKLSLDAQTTAKWYMDGQFALLEQKINDSKGDSTQKLADLENMHKLFFSAVESLDGKKDGKIELQPFLDSIIANVASNKTLIDAATVAVETLETAMNKEVQDRIAQGTTLSTLVETVRSNLQTQISSLKDRVRALETGVSDLTEWATTLTEGVPAMFASAMTDIDSLFGKSTDAQEAPVL